MRGPSPLPYMDSAAQQQALGAAKAASRELGEQPTIAKTQGGAVQRFAGDAFRFTGIQDGEMAARAGSPEGRRYLQQWAQLMQSGFFGGGDPASGGVA